MRPRVYAWVNEHAAWGFGMVAVAEDGTSLQSVRSSSYWWAHDDLGFGRTASGGWTERGRVSRMKYEAHYPDGYELVWVEDKAERKRTDERFAAMCRRLDALANAVAT